MSRKAVPRAKRAVTGGAIPSMTLQAGTKDCPILLLSDDEGKGEECTRRPLEPTPVPQKRYLGVSPFDAYTFKGQGIAHDMMIAMGYKPDSGLGPNLRGSANSRCMPGVSDAYLFPPRKCTAAVD